VNSVVGLIKHCCCVFLGVGWSMNSAMEPTKKMQNAHSSLDKRTLYIVIYYILKKLQYILKK